tara:strand:- start:8900 stop:9850 length:951 start_codon:yes stop_codon:yes gene_type:complete
MKNSFEFFTFFLGIQKSELIKLQNLIDTFPYFNNYKINVIDKSEPSLKLANKKDERFYDSPRSYFQNYKPNITLDEINHFFNSNVDKINRIKEKEYSFHGEGVEKVLKKYAKKKYVIIMDSDIVFHNDTYLHDIISFINNSNDEIAAIGSIVQKQLFHLTINKIFTTDFLFMFSNDNNINFRRKIKITIKEMFSLVLKLFKILPKNRNSSLGRFPRLHPLLLMINKEYFLDNNLRYGYSYLTVINHENIKKDKIISEHRILGDSGATLLSSISESGGKIINIDYNDYVKHSLKGSYGEATASHSRWNWFSKSNLSN